jgi:putative PIN family toxin of toxin-antitoxin system
MNDENKPTVVIDTNLFISAIIIKGNNTPNKLVTAWREHKYHLAISEELYTELGNVLKREKIYRKYQILPQEIEEFLAELRNTTMFVSSLNLDMQPIHSRDSNDDKFLSCALSGSCDYLITGDEDLLVLNGRPELRKLQIIKAADFLQRNA